MPIRSALYVDGFNLYHAVVELGEPFLKWCNLRTLGELIIPRTSETLVKVVFCSAYYPGDERKRWRHEQFLNALRVADVTCVMGHYVREPKQCKSCGANWEQPTEKETDINVALNLFIDGFGDVYDKAYLLTSDSDQAASAKLFRTTFPNRTLVTVCPPGRKPSIDISKHAHQKITLNKDHIERSLFGPMVFKEGMPAGRRPREYDPPAGWVPFDQRPV